MRTLWLLLLALCTAARADERAPFMWQVEGPKATHYLLGSIHLMPREAQQLPGPIQDAYDAVDGLMFETDIGKMGQPQTQLGLLASARSPQGLKAEVGDKMYAELARYAAQLGMPMSLCQPYKAWFCALSLEVFTYRKAGFTGDDGIDEQIYRWAQEDGKTVRWFEPPSEQIGLFTGMPPALARDFLASSMDHGVSAGDDDPTAILRAWRDNDTAAIAQLDAELKHRYPAVYQHLLAQRNRNWLPQLVRVIEGERATMVVAGAAHWVGPDGLVALLKARGYKVSPYVAPESQLVTQLRPPLQSVAWRR
ncbi:MAG: TraB/GumN family protein [Nevskia sp.]|nr:TraB/GumN family protein [Nevskia sp.]